MTVAVGTQFVQQGQPLRRQLCVQQAHAGEVAARPVQAGDKAELDRVEAHDEHDRNSRGGGLGRHSRRAIRDNHADPTLNQIGRQCRQLIILAVRPAKFDGHVPALVITGFAQPVAERA
jgi:hypothetical protein